MLGPKNMIKKSYIKEYFKTINSIKNLDLEKELNWGFYFSHKEKQHLINISKNSALNKYDFKEIVSCDNIYYLQIAKNEIHTEESLFKRCVELYEFSKIQGIDRFDGFDVEEVL
jgi:hypothetical protein